MSDSPCPDSQSLRAFSRGELGNEAANSVAAHLDQCNQCAAQLAASAQPTVDFHEGWKNESHRHQGPEELGTRDRATISLADADMLAEQPRNGDGREPSSDDSSHPSTVDFSMSETGDHGPQAAKKSFTADASNAAPDAPKDLPRIPDYEVLSFIARGGMGMVLKARHRVLNRPAAIKVPRVGDLANDGDRQRFLREARAAARLAHANICPIYEVGEADGVPFLAMAFVEGVTLNQWVKDSQPNARQIAEVMAVLARAVAFAHGHDVLHRDLKPANVMVENESGQPILMDFGLAKELTADVEEASLTVTGQVLGTPSYMAPEQAAGQIDRVGPHTDIYALGGVLYYLITGQAPFTGSLADVLTKVQNEEPPRPAKLSPRVHRDLETICLRAMAKEPEARYASAEALAEDLERFCAGEPILARREGLVGKSLRMARRKPVVATFAALTVVLAVTVLLLGWHSVRSAKLAQLTGQFETGLARQQWTDDSLRRLQLMLDQVGRIDADAALELEERLRTTLGRHIQQLTNSARMTTSLRETIERELSLLEGLDPAQAEQLNQAYQRRLTDWEPVFQLAAPWENVDEIIPSGQIKNLDELLHAKSQTLSTKIRSSGKVRLQAEFGSGWTSAHRLALCIGMNAKDHNDVGYRFELLAKWSGTDDDVPTSFAAIGEAGGKIKARLLRNGLLLREEEIAVPAGNLRLTARREVQHLTFQVNDVPPLEFIDPFPVADHGQRMFAVITGPDAGLKSLSASRQPLVPEPSLLERGDELFLQGQVAAGLAEFERQAAISGDTEVVLEARYKQAQCLAALKRFSEARAILETLTEEPGDRWPAIAACLLWEIQLKEHGPDAAYAIFQDIVLRYKSSALNKVVPAYVVQDSVYSCREEASALRLLEHNPDRVASVERAINIHEYFGIRDALYYENKLYLCRALCMEEDYHQATRLIGELVSSLPDIHAFERRRWIQMWETFGWLMRVQNRAATALAKLDGCLFTKEKVLREPHFILLIERARLHAAMGKTPEAMEDLKRFFELADPNTLEYAYMSAGCLVNGFLLEELGQTDAAAAAWQAGMPNPPYDWLAIRRVEGLLNAMVVSSLAEGITPEEIDRLINRVIAKLGKMFNPVLVRTTVGMLLDDFTPATLSRIANNVFRSPEGHQVARQLAFRELTIAEMLRKATGELAITIADEVIIEGDISPEQAALLRQLGSELLDEYYHGRITQSHLLQLGLTWKGLAGPGGWQTLAPSLEPQLRGPLAYLFGLRYLRTGSRLQAISFFEAARTDTPADSNLARLATAELVRLQETSADQAN